MWYGASAATVLPPPLNHVFLGSLSSYQLTESPFYRLVINKDPHTTLLKSHTESNLTGPQKAINYKCPLFVSLNLKQFFFLQKSLITFDEHSFIIIQSVNFISILFNELFDYTHHKL